MPQMSLVAWHALSHRLVILRW